MEAQNTPDYRVSVLLELSHNPELVLYNAAQLTKRLGGTLEVFHVKSAGESTADAPAEIETLIAQHQKHGERLPIGHRLEYGNVKHRIRDYLAMLKPDVLVMGKRRNRMGILGESITEFVIDQTNATNIFIFGEGQRLGSFDELHLGVFGRNLNEKGKSLIMDLKKDSKSAVRLFDINPQTGETEQPTYPWHGTAYISMATDHSVCVYPKCDGLGCADQLCEPDADATAVHAQGTKPNLCVPNECGAGSAAQSQDSVDDFSVADGKDSGFPDLLFYIMWIIVQRMTYNVLQSFLRLEQNM